MSSSIKNKWDNIPNEILEIILEKSNNLKRSNIYPFLFINKQWFYIVQSMLYESVTIKSLGDTITNGIVLDTLVYSTYQPGRWVKTITLSGLKKPSSEKYDNKQEDPLCTLMLCCPNIINLDGCAETIDWTRFSAAQQATGVWKLQMLPEYTEIARYNTFVTYLHCAHHFKDTLKEFAVWTPLKEEDYRCLGEFKILKRLKINNRGNGRTGIPLTFQDLSRYLVQYLNQVQEIEVEFPDQLDPLSLLIQAFFAADRVNYSEDDRMQDGNDDDDDDMALCEERNRHIHLKKLRFSNFAHPGDAQFLLLASKLDQLEKIELYYSNVTAPPTEAVVNFARGIPRYRINFETKEETQYIERYFDYSAGGYGGRVQQQKKLVINFSSYPTEEELTPGGKLITIDNRQSNTTEVIEVSYNMEYHPKQQFERTKELFFLSSNYIKHIHLVVERGAINRFYAWTEQADTYLNLLNNISQTSCLDHLSLSGPLTLFTYKLGKTRPPSSNIKYLELIHTEIDANILPQLSISFPALDLLQFENCWFGHPDISVNMSNSSIGVISFRKPLMQKHKPFGMQMFADLFAGENQTTPVHISIVPVLKLSSNGYYFVCSGHGQVERIAEETYKTSVLEKKPFIQVIVKSIKKLILEMKHISCSIDLEEELE